MLASTARNSTLLCLAAILGGCGSADEPRQTGTLTTTVTSNDASGEDDATQTTTGSNATSSVESASTTSTATTQTTAPETTQGSEASSTTTTAAESTGTSSVCDGVDDGEFIPPVACDGPNGNTSTEVPSNGVFSTSWFGCYYDGNGSIIQDPGDNCEFACGPQGLCDPGQSGPECEAELQWFAADADRFGCGGRILVTNCDNGNAVVLATLDRGPNCNSVEMQCDAPVLDMSHDAMIYLFEGNEYGGCEHHGVVVVQVDDATPLGPV